MPRWYQHAKAFTALRRRYNLNVDPTEFSSGIVPTVEADRHWMDDRLNIWGMFLQAFANGATARYRSCMLVTQRKEALVYRVEAALRGTGYVSYTVGCGCHLFTPLQTYNPVAEGPAIWFPWLQTAVREADPGSLPETFGMSGRAVAQQVVVVNGTPYTSVGPVRFAPYIDRRGTGAVPVYLYADPDVRLVWEFQDPPLRLAPFTELCVQDITPFTSATYSLDVNFWFCEREDQGRVG